MEHNSDGSLDYNSENLKRVQQLVQLRILLHLQPTYYLKKLEVMGP